MDIMQRLAFDSQTEIVAAVLFNSEGLTELRYLGESPNTEEALAPLKARGMIFAGVIAFRCGRVVVEPEPSAGMEALRILARASGDFCSRLNAEGHSAEWLERLYRLPDTRDKFCA
jgi:hypothetical protein